MSTPRNIEGKHYITIEWHIDDVKSLIDEDEGELQITDECAMNILNYVLKNHDCNFGITWDHISGALVEFKQNGKLEYEQPKKKSKKIRKLL